MSAQPMHDETKWQTMAACHGEMGSVFYPPMRPERKAVRLAREQRAKAVCASCTVRQECLDHALATNERFGVWGGTTEKQRRKLSHIG